MPRAPAPPAHRVDRQIRSPEVRLLDEEGNQLGVVPLYQALDLAREKDLNLVEVAPNAVPPVCRILDYGKFKYEEEKKERQAKKHQHTSELKELRLRPRTDEHDLQVRVRAARKFLEEGHKVRLLLRFRGRESSHPEVGRAQILQVADALSDIAFLELPPQTQGQSMSAILARGKPREAAAAPRPPAGQPPQAAPAPPAPAPQAAQPTRAPQPSRAPQPPPSPRPAPAPRTGRE